MRRPAKQRWSDLTPERQAAVIGAGVVQVGLLVAALTDLWRRPSAEVNGRKAVWAAVCFVNFVGPLAYFAFGRRR
jgi:phospholipase D-like protein